MKYNVQLNQAELNIIGLGLAQLQLGVTNLVSSITAQLQPESTPESTPAPVESI